MGVSDILGQFQQLIASVPTEEGAGSTELLLQGYGSAEAQLLRRCAIPHQFSVPLLGVLSPNLSEHELRQYYEDFTQLPIITPSAEILMMHDQSRRYLFRQWLKPERETEFAAISGRLAEFFKTKRDQASLPNDKEFFERRGMFHFTGFDQDSGIVEFERLAREKRRQFRLTECESLIKLIHEYDDVLTPQNRVRLIYHEGKLATDRRDWDRAKALFETIAENSSALPEYRIKALNRLGMVHAELRQFPTAIAYYQRAHDLATAQRYPEVFRTLLELGSAHRESGNLSKAEQLLNEGITLAKKAQNFFSVAVGYNSLGMLHRRLNDIPRAIGDYQQSLENLERAGEKFRRGQVLSELGTAYTERRDWPTAEKYFLESLEIERQAGDKHNQAIVLNNLARVYQNRRQHSDALEAAREAIRLFHETRDSYRAAMATRNLAKLYRAMKDRTESERAFRDAIEQFRRCNEIDAAKDTERELAAFTRKVGLPWWAWLIIILLILLLISLALPFFGVIR